VLSGTLTTSGANDGPLTLQDDKRPPKEDKQESESIELASVEA
jgi:hypothetical protein